MKEFLIMRSFKPRAFSISDLYDWYNQTPMEMVEKRRIVSHISYCKNNPT